MYIPTHFEETDSQKIKALIEAAPLAIITAHTSKGLVGHHIPLLLEGEDKLIGHIAKENTLHEELADGSEVLVIFKAEDAYISPNWYPSKHEHHKQVPTWNYQVAHIHGHILFKHDDKSKRAVVGRLTKYFENMTNGKTGWKMADAPKDYLDDLLDNIVAFDITISQILAKSKLNQNKSNTDIQSVAENLIRRGKTKIGKAMQGKD